jgi:hypothetical protein
MTNCTSSFIVSLGSASRDQAGGALTSAAVPRVGLGPTTPPLCRYGERTTDLILHAWRVLNRKLPSFTPPLQGGECFRASYLSYSQPWRLVCTAQRHKGGGRRPGDSCEAVHTKRRGGYSPVTSTATHHNSLQLLSSHFGAHHALRLHHR